MKEPGPGKGHPRKKMKLNEQAKDDKDSKESKDIGKEIPKDIGKEKGAAKGSKDAKAGALMERTTSSNAMSNGADTTKEGNQQKEKVKAGETGGMISPESLEAT